MLTVTLLLVLAALVLVCMSAMNKAPLWGAVLMLVVAHLLQLLPR